MPKGKEEGLLKLEIFNNLAENLKNSKIVEKFMEELNNTLERNNSENIINNKNLIPKKQVLEYMQLKSIAYPHLCRIVQKSQQ